jgi:hypothetical protein
MKQINKLLNAAWAAVIALSLAGCNQPQAKEQNAEGTYAALRDRFSAQQSFYFYGRTKLLAGQTANGNAVNFSGQKQGNDIYMKVRLSFPERKRVDTLSLLSKDRRLYAKLSDETGWRSLDKRDVSLQQEFNNWNPVFSFQQIEEMRKSVLPLDDRNPHDHVEAIRVLLDSDKMKAWLARQMKQQVGGQIQSAHVPKLKAAMQLSDGDWRRFAEGTRIQANQTRGDIDELIDQMELEAEYTIYYDRRSMLPTSLVMSIRSEYDLDDQRVHEHSQVETFLQDYGQSRELPKPAAGRAGS